MISVIVPVYIVEPYLQQCVDSILNQTYRDLEVLLIDDGSPDRCGEICDEYGRKDKRVRVFHTENRGLSAARNLGLKEARGDYIGFVDSDDWIEPEMYEVLLRGVEETGADIGVCGFWVEDQRTNIHHTKPQPLEQARLLTGTDSLRRLINGYIYNRVWNKLYRKGLYDSISFPEGKNYEDIALMYKLLAKAKGTVICSNIEYHYRVRDDSICQTNSGKNLMDGVDAMISRYYYYKNIPELFKDCEDNLLCTCAGSISNLWFCWGALSLEEKELYKTHIEELKQFSREHLSPFMPGKLSMKSRFSIIFLRSSSKWVFDFLHVVNTIHSKRRFR